MSHTRRASCNEYWLLIFALGVLTAACGGSSSRSTQPPPAATVSADTWAVVNGQAITRDDVDKAYRRMQDGAQAQSEEETAAAKLSLLDDLITQEILLSKARTLKIDVAVTDLDTAYANAKKNITDEAFQQELTKRNLTPADMREGLRRGLLTEKLIEQEIKSKIAVTDQEVTDFFNTNRAQFNLAEESYHIAQIVVTPVRDAQTANRTGDDAATPQAAAAKVQMLMERLKAGVSFRDLAAGYSEDPESAPRGGDLGLVPVSRLKGAPPQLRNAVIGKTAGSVNVASSERRTHAGAGRRPRAGGTTRPLDAGRARAHHRDAEIAQGAAAARRISRRRAQRRDRRELLCAPAGRVQGNGPEPSPRRSGRAIVPNRASCAYCW